MSGEDGQKTVSDLKVFVLPDEDEIRKRVLGVSQSPFLVPYLVEFVPFVARHLAGEQRVGPGVLMALQLALYDFKEETGNSPVVIAAIDIEMRALLEALIDDEEIRNDAFEILDEVEAELERQREARRAAARS